MQFCDVLYYVEWGCVSAVVACTLYLIVIIPREFRTIRAKIDAVAQKLIDLKYEKGSKEQ